MDKAGGLPITDPYIEAQSDDKNVKDVKKERCDDLI